MTLSELVTKIEEQGYVLSGKENITEKLMKSDVIVAPLVLIPTEPPVEKDCQMIPDVLVWEEFKAKGWLAVKGRSRIEGAATLKPATVVRLQFVAKRG